MATILKTYDFTRPSHLTPAGETRKSYPWADWFDGRIWKLKEGEDFDAHPLMMERIIRTRASTDRAKLKMRHEALNGDPWGILILQNQAPEDTKLPGKATPAKKKAAPPKDAPVARKKAPTAKRVPSKKLAKRS